MEADAESRVWDYDEWSLPYKDRALITVLVKSASNDPILDIITLGPFHVQVTTGVVKGALNGGGGVFECKKTNGKWRIVREWKWVS